MHTLRLRFATAAAAFLFSSPALPAADGPALPIAAGPYQPTMESLTNYHCPDWFRDAKFGIWAHWGPQAVPMMGDWSCTGSSGR